MMLEAIGSAAMLEQLAEEAADHVQAVLHRRFNLGAGGTPNEQHVSQEAD